MEKVKFKHWGKTAARVTAVGVCNRDWKVVRKKLQDLACDARKYKAKFNRTGKQQLFMNELHSR